MTLTEFLLARIAEDEAVARAATPGPWQWEPEDQSGNWGDSGGSLETVARGPRYSDGSQGAEATVIGAWGHDAWGLDVSAEDAAHIARWDPARVLAECEAKRQILNSIRALASSDWPLSQPVAMAIDSMAGALALPYRDHPGYDERWKP